MLTLPVTEITKLKVEPGDVVVVKAAKIMSQTHAEALKKRITDLLPGVDVLLLDPDVSLSVMTPPAKDVAGAEPEALEPDGHGGLTSATAKKRSSRKKDPQP